MVFPAVFNLSPNSAIRSWWSKPQSAAGLVFCWLYRAFPSSAAKNIINLISVLTIWWCPRVESSLMLLEKGVCYDQCIFLTNFLTQFSHSVVSDSLWPHALQHARLPCIVKTAKGWEPILSQAPLSIVVHIVTYFILSINRSSSYYFHPHFTAEKNRITNWLRHLLKLVSKTTRI